MKKDFWIIPAWSVLFSVIIFAIHHGVILLFSVYGLWLEIICALLAWAGYVFIGLMARKKLSFVTVLASSATLCAVSLLQLPFEYNWFLYGAFFMFQDMFPFLFAPSFTMIVVIRIITYIAPLGFMLFLIKRKTPQAVETPVNITE